VPVSLDLYFHPNIYEKILSEIADFKMISIGRNRKLLLFKFCCFGLKSMVLG